MEGAQGEGRDARHDLHVHPGRHPRAWSSGHLPGKASLKGGRQIWDSRGENRGLLPPSVQQPSRSQRGAPGTPPDPPGSPSRVLLVLPTQPQDTPRCLARADGSQAPVSSKNQPRTFLKPGQAIVPKITWSQDFQAEGLPGNRRTPLLIQDPIPPEGSHIPTGFTSLPPPCELCSQGGLSLLLPGLSSDALT